MFAAKPKPATYTNLSQKEGCVLVANSAEAATPSLSGGTMQSLRSSILNYLRVKVSVSPQFLSQDGNGLKRLDTRLYACCTSSGSLLMDRVIRLVKKFDKLDSSMVTERADFEKDLSLDSLDRVELVMAFEEEFSIEIPDDEADRLKCCSDVAKYIESKADKKTC